MSSTPPKKVQWSRSWSWKRAIRINCFFKKETPCQCNIVCVCKQTDTMYENLMIMGYSLRFLKSLHQSLLPKKSYCKVSWPKKSLDFKYQTQKRGLNLPITSVLYLRTPTNIHTYIHTCFIYMESYTINSISTISK